MFIFTARDREYAEWTTEPAFPGTLDPAARKLLTGDSINSKGRIIHPSPSRTDGSIPGVLCISRGSHGRKGKRLLYTCVPFSRDLPVFLVPYAPKKASFTKCPSDLYILFKLDAWEGKHPHGISTQTLGPVSSLPATYEYLAHSYSVHVPIQRLTRAAFNAIREHPSGARGLELELEQTAPDHSGGLPQLVTIDPEGATDLDDAIGASTTVDGGFKVAIAITDPSYWLDRLGLWDHLTNKVATLYFPGGKKPMLPGAALSDGLCSLKAGHVRPCLVLVVDLGPDGKPNAERLTWTRCAVRTNEIYESPSLLGSRAYKVLAEATAAASRCTRLMGDILDSHDVVAFWMTWFNLVAARKLDTLRTGIFRTAPPTARVDPPTGGVSVPASTLRVRRFWGKGGGTYTLWEDREAHGGIGEGNMVYAQATSPIRRVVDLVNVLCLLNGSGIRSSSSKAMAFASTWLERVPEIQRYTRAAQRVQSKCELLHLCCAAMEEGETEFDGYPIREEDSTSTSGGTRYLVHVPRLQNLVRVNAQAPLALMERVRLKLHLFLDESVMCRKVRVSVLAEGVLS